MGTIGTARNCFPPALPVATSVDVRSKDPLASRCRSRCHSHPPSFTRCVIRASPSPRFSLPRTLPLPCAATCGTSHPRSFPFACRACVSRATSRNRCSPMARRPLLSPCHRAGDATGRLSLLKYVSRRKQIINVSWEATVAFDSSDRRQSAGDDYIRGCSSTHRLLLPSLPRMTDAPRSRVA